LPADLSRKEALIEPSRALSAKATLMPSTGPISHGSGKFRAATHCHSSQDKPAITTSITRQLIHIDIKLNHYSAKCARNSRAPSEKPGTAQQITRLLL
jgi:hypothetical protein